MMVNKLKSIKLRPATINDLSLLQHWDEQPHILASDPNDDWSWDKELNRSPDWREQLVAELNGRPIGFVQIIDPAREESKYWGNVPASLRAIDIWIGDTNDLGKGYGTELMHQAITRCFEDSAVKAIIIDPLASNTRAHQFYERLGFRFSHQQRFGEDECFVYQLDREHWEKVHG